jgi:hypothetical protein
MRILGCWYSNNVLHSKILSASLSALKRAQESTVSCRVDIRTCTWAELPGNPFVGYTTFFPIGVHFGIVLQILKIIYEEARRGGRYDAICFLEHDVLYPADYFDRMCISLNQNPDKQGVFNMDYIGLNHTGWLDVRVRHKPMHQLCLRYDYAKQHLESLVKKCILDGSEMLEPHDKSLFAEIPFLGDRPSCHINHSKHFTNHYDTYEPSSNGLENHPYWGNFRVFYPEEERSLQKV